MKKNKLVGSMGAPTVSKRLLKLSALSLSMMCLPLAHAEEAASAEQPTKVQKVTVTGSSIKGVAAQSASPITIIKGEDLAKQGVTTVEEALSKVSANQSDFNTARNVGMGATSGSTASLRGLGSDKTLVLLNGRRLAYSPYSASSTNLNIIPMGMIERIEVLRDGASAVYGADAIAGVINFITKDEYEGLSVSGTIHETEHAGGEEKQASIFGGYGDLNEQGFNIMGVIDYRKSESIHAKDRSFSRRGTIIPELGFSEANGSGAPFPANIVGLPTGSANPYISDCGNVPNTYPVGTICRLNTQALIRIAPETENLSTLIKGKLRLNDNLNAVGEYVFTRSEVITSVAPDVYIGPGGTVSLDPTSKYYPGSGITPSVDGVTGQPLTLQLRSQAGNRIGQQTEDAHRIFTGIEGEALGWDVNAGIAYAKSKATDSLLSGYLHKENLQDALNAGLVNPFGPSAVGDTPWESFSVTGDTQTATLESTTVDFTISRPIYALPAGDVGFALGASYTTQDWRSTVNNELAAMVPSTGTSAGSPPSSGDRSITAIFSEVHIPILSSLEAQLAARYDNYDDVGDTFNPKIALRWEPLKELMFRTSYSTGFKAPTMSDMYAQAAETNTSQQSDPILCPNGVAVSPVYDTECNTQFKRRSNGTPTLEAEESTSFTAGFVYEPIKNLVFTMDYFNIEIDNLISGITELDIFADPIKYADNFVRDSDGTIAYINEVGINAGGEKVSGIDVSLNYLTPQTSTGRWGFGIDGTYTMNHEYQLEKNGEWDNLLGQYVYAPISRWKHVANINWSYKDWSMILEQQFKGGYLDYYGERHVGDSTLYNFATTYKGFNNLEITGGILNMFDETPPASDTQELFQVGYDPRHGDHTGRTFYLRGTYNF